MANTIALRKQYSTLLDEVYKLSSLTAVLDGPNELVKEGANANEILIPKLSMQGLADYNKRNVLMTEVVCLMWMQWITLNLPELHSDVFQGSF